VTRQPFTGFEGAVVPRETDLESIMVLVSGWSVIKPSITIIFLSSLTFGINGVIQLFTKNRGEIKIIIYICLSIIGFSNYHSTVEHCFFSNHL